MIGGHYMSEMKSCESCGMQLDSAEAFGTNADNSKNEEYCIHCYKDGSFTANCSMEEMIEINLKYLEEWNKEQGTNFTKEEAREQLREFLPTLKRWKCTCTEECASGYNPNCTCTSSECHCTEKPN